MKTTTIKTTGWKRLLFSTTTTATTITTRQTSTSRSMSSSSSSKETLLQCPTFDMPNAIGSMKHPAIGFGTYKVGVVPKSASSNAAASSTGEKERTALECVKDALDCGYRFLECAQFYDNQAQVGEAIVQSCGDGLNRKDLFLVSKVWTTTMEQGDAAIRAQLMKTLQELQTDYLDLYLIHWPVPGHHVKAYKTLERLQDEGLIRGIGLSNYAVEDYEELVDAGMVKKPCVNQIEINPFLYRKKTIEFFKKEGVLLQSYRSLRDGKAFDNPTLLALATKYSKTVAQILGRWCIQHGFVYVPKSVKKVRMEENGCVFDFELSTDDMDLLDGMTTPDALDTFQTLYRKCVNRDTSKDGTLEGVKMNITID